MDDFERKVLAEIADPGSQEGLRWGAGMSLALEMLQRSGHVTRGPRPQITDAGRKALEET